LSSGAWSVSSPLLGIGGAMTMIPLLTLIVKG
jgi:uncharacterized membrane protein YfcA